MLRVQRQVILPVIWRVLIVIEDPETCLVLVFWSVLVIAVDPFFQGPL